MIFNENIEPYEQTAEKSMDPLPKLLISHLLVALEYQTSYHYNAET